jgi:hypothetical protein
MTRSIYFFLYSDMTNAVHSELDCTTGLKDIYMRML